MLTNDEFGERIHQLIENGSFAIGDPTSEWGITLKVQMSPGNYALRR